nr:hypothetical protein [Tanacetum cinerariifolium]
EADWLELLAKIATNSALSKQLSGDDVTEENMNERLGMVLLRKRRELAEQSRVPAASSQVPAAPSFLADVSVHADTSSAPADISVPAVSPTHIAASVPAKTVVHTAESHVDDPLTASEHVSTKPTVDAPTPSSSRSRRKHIAKKWSLDDEDALDFWHNQDSWRICSWRLYPHAQVHVLETVDGWIIHMFVDVSYPLTVGTLERMLKHGLEVPKLLVGGDLTMAEQLVGFIKAALLNAKSTV